MAEAGVGHYVYCVMAAGSRPSFEDAVGVDAAHPVEILEHVGLAAVTGRVSLAEFGSGPLERNLNDLDWLARTARRHEAVLDRALAAGPIVPLRLGTIFADPERVRRMLEHEHDGLADALTRLGDRTEWGVKVIADALAFRGPEPEAAQTGRAYLEHRSRERRAHEEAQALAVRAAEEVHERLRRQASEATLLRPQSPELSGRRGAMIMNGAYLVDRAGVDRFRAAAEELAERQRPLGLALEVTGPWPPYNFTNSPHGLR